LLVTNEPDVIIGEGRDGDDLHGWHSYAARPRTASASQASLRVSCAAGSGPPRGAACPAHIGPKPNSPRFSAAARTGANAALASGYGGASGRIGPSSFISRPCTPRPSPPVLRLVKRVPASCQLG